MEDYWDLLQLLNMKNPSVNCQTSLLQEQSPSNATSLAMMQEPQEVVEETVTIEEDPGTPTSHVSVVTSDDGTTRRTETKVRRHVQEALWYFFKMEIAAPAVCCLFQSQGQCMLRVLITVCFHIIMMLKAVSCLKC